MIKYIYLKSFEFLAIFVMLPLFFVYKIFAPYLVIPILWILSFYVLYILNKSNVLFLFDNKINRQDLFFVIKRFILLSSLMILFTYIFYEDKLFNFLLEKPSIYFIVIFLYPLLSVIPQELIFRKFFLFRYEILFTPTALIILNGLVFGFIHIIFNNYIAVIFSFVGGVIFMKTYIKTKSFSLVCLEHALYGDFIFTIGLGEFFYHGSIN